MIKPDRMVKVAFAVAKVATSSGYGTLRGAATGVQGLSADLFEVGRKAKNDIASSEELAMLGISKDEALCLALVYTLMGEQELAHEELRKAGRNFVKIGRRLLEETGSERIYL